jgi:hypothetical protein
MFGLPSDDNRVEILRTLWNSDEQVRGTDPFQASATFTVDGDRLTVVNEDLTVIETGRARGETRQAGCPESGATLPPRGFRTARRRSQALRRGSDAAVPGRSSCCRR